MILHVKGSNKAVRKLIEHATWYYAEKLMGLRLMGSLELTINLKKNLLSKEGNEGSAVWEDDGFRPKEFTIELDTTVKIRNLLITLAHEMVHIKQYVMSELTFKREKMCWKNEVIGDMTEEQYYCSPHEVEAYGKEKWLQLGYTAVWNKIESGEI